MDKIDKIIKEKYQFSFMNNTKWEKLIDCVTDVEDEVFVNYKLVHTEAVYQTSFYKPDFKPFFIEPTLYKEVEWIEFPKCYEDYVSRSNLKAGRKVLNQDVNTLKEAIEKIGNFEIIASSLGFKIYAYK